MTQIASRPNPRAVAFSHWLRGQIARKQISQRALGKQIDRDDPVRGRRQVVRHLSGQHFPSAPMRARYAEVFGEDFAEPGASDEEEEGDLAVGLNRLAREARRLAKRAELLHGVAL